MLPRSRYVKCIFTLIIIIILVQIYHLYLWNLLNMQSAKETFTYETYTNYDLIDIVTRIENKLQNADIVDGSGSYYVISNLLRSHYINSKNLRLRNDVTIATQCSSNHLHHMINLTNRWNGPISVSVFTVNEHFNIALRMIVDLYYCHEQIKKWVSFNLVYPLSQYPKTIPNDLLKFRCGDLSSEYFKLYVNYETEREEYPHNLLRNLAIKKSVTDFVFMIDVDMVPSTNLRKDFLLFQSSIPLGDNLTRSTVFVVPTFEVKESVMLPNNKTELLELWNGGTDGIQPFYKNTCWKCQRHTDYEKWGFMKPGVGLRVAYYVQWKDPWEPFFIGNKQMPMYDERFKQYGFNRISQVCELHVAQYNFAVLDNAFVLHKGFKYPGKFHKSLQEELDKNRQLFRLFKEELKTKYSSSVRRCY